MRASTFEPFIPRLSWRSLANKALWQTKAQINSRRRGQTSAVFVGKSELRLNGVLARGGVRAGAGDKKIPIRRNQFGRLGDDD